METFSLRKDSTRGGTVQIGCRDDFVRNWIHEEHLLKSPDFPNPILFCLTESHMARALVQISLVLL